MCTWAKDKPEKSYNMEKIHFASRVVNGNAVVPCSIFKKGNFTDELHEVTCKGCIKKLKEYGDLDE